MYPSHIANSRSRKALSVIPLVEVWRQCNWVETMGGVTDVLCGYRDVRYYFCILDIAFNFEEKLFWERKADELNRTLEAEREA